MAYVSLLSENGLDALKRSLEAPTVARVAKGKLTVDDALGMEEREALAAFQVIRFADTNGLPKCPKCGSTDTYEIRRRGFRCQHCTHDFSITSSTMLHGRKLGMAKYLAMLALVLDRHQYRSLLAFSNETRIGYKTVWQQINHFRACTVDSNGCTVPFAVLTRDAWKLRCEQVRSNLGRFMTEPKNQNYPYLSKHNAESDGADLLKFVNRLVPNWVPDHMRADICQDMIVAILTGDVTREQLRADSRKYMVKTFADFPWKYKWMSFDMPLGEKDKCSLHDIISNEHAADMYNAVTHY